MTDPSVLSAEWEAARASASIGAREAARRCVCGADQHACNAGGTCACSGEKGTRWGSILGSLRAEAPTPRARAASPRQATHRAGRDDGVERPLVSRSRRRARPRASPRPPSPQVDKQPGMAYALGGLALHVGEAEPDCWVQLANQLKTSCCYCVPHYVRKPPSGDQDEWKALLGYARKADGRSWETKAEYYTAWPRQLYGALLQQSSVYTSHRLRRR